MLTWAVAWYMQRSGKCNGIWFLMSIIGDVMMVYYIAEAIKH